MNKSAIKNFAVRARKKLIENITQKAYEVGVSGKKIEDIERFEGGFRVNNRIFKDNEKDQRNKLVEKVKEKGFEQVIEEVSYTWFNRFIALRFMEVNEYLPSGVRVLSSITEGKKEPDIIKEALNLDFGIDNEKKLQEHKDKVYFHLDSHDSEGLFKYLLIKQCNELSKIMPVMFEKIADFTELLLPDNLLVEGSVIMDLVDSIEEKDFKEQVEIIGWLYQYYISEKKDEVFAGLKKNKKITKENIPAATQLFTPAWIVKYMVENSLGRLWLEGHPDEELKSKWKYYLEEAQQEPEVERQLEEIRNKNKDLTPEDLTFLDPAMGSGHILVYAFDVLYDIYKSAGYSEREIPKLILEKNLYGLDIDDRAGQLAYFALMMKARSKNRRIFRDEIKLNVCAIQESNGISKEAMDFFIGDVEELRDDVEYLVDVFHDAKEYGSILKVREVDVDRIQNRLNEIRGIVLDSIKEIDYRDEIDDKLINLIKQSCLMSKEYFVVCTNPPYMGRKGMNNKIMSFLDNNFKNSKNDMFSVFIDKGLKYLNRFGINSMVTMQSWMFLHSMEQFRRYILTHNYIISLVHMSNMVMQIAFGTSATVFRNICLEKYNASYVKVDYKDLSGNFEPINKFVNKGYIKTKKIYDFYKLPGCPISYWVNEYVIDKINSSIKVDDLADVKQGMATCNNDKFLRFWFEVSSKECYFEAENSVEAENSEARWFPYNKGGSFRKWYGNNIYLVNWWNNGEDIKKYTQELSKDKPGGRVKNEEYYFKECLTWSTLSSGGISFRKSLKGFLFDTKGSIIYVKKMKLYNYLLALFNSRITEFQIGIFAPTMDYNPNSLRKVGISLSDKFFSSVNDLSKQNISISKTDWDSFETSWDFEKHPLLKFHTATIEQSFNNWAEFTNTQFDQLKSNEEELNRIFIDIYGLQDELTPEVEDKDVTIRKADRVRDIKSFISYAVGCMFGRYSLDEDGLIYAGGEFIGDRYKTFKADKDNIIPIPDDTYFGEDIVSRFVEFVKVTFGEETLDDNLAYIAETLEIKNNETPRECIRRYFMAGFYKDHTKIYKKRPIYWLFDSGKQNGFKALIYMHRYDKHTAARVRTDYLHELQKAYEGRIKELERIVESNTSKSELMKARKAIEKIKKQLNECTAYDQVIAHVAHQSVEIDLDDGVAVNYEKLQGIEVPQGEGKKPLMANLLQKI